jgi:hypothetical protein
VTPCLAEVHQHFRGTYSLDLQAAQKMEAARSSKTPVNFHSTKWHHITEEDSIRHRHHQENLKLYIYLLVKSVDEAIVSCYIYLPLRSDANSIDTETYFTCIDTLQCLQIPLFYLSIIATTE